MTVDTEASAAPLDAVGGQVSPRRRAMTKLLSATPFYLTGVLLLMAIVFSVLRPDAFPTVANGRNILTDVSILLVMAVGMTYVMVAGGFDLSIGSILVFSGVIAAKAMGAVGGEGWPPVFAGLVAAVISGIAWGLFNGFCIARLITDGNDVRTVPLSLITLSIDQWLGLPVLVWLSAAIAVIGGLHLAYTRFGRHTYIVGSNSEAARRAGINVDRHLVKLSALSGLLAGVAGMMSLTRFATTTIAGHTQDALQVITGVVLGGTSLFGGVGTVVGTTVGMFISAVLNNGLIVVDVKPFWQEVAIGFILIVAVFIDQRRRSRRDRG